MHAINLWMISLLLVTAIVVLLQMTRRHSIGFLYAAPWPPLARGLLAIIVIDGWLYLFHRTEHWALPLWRFHRVHHSDDQVDTTTALRFHVGEKLLSLCATALFLIPLVGFQLKDLLLYEICYQPFNLLHHSNLTLPERWDRIIRLVFVSPNMHRVHHSQQREETNSNYSNLLSIWDRLAGTFRLRSELQTLKYGLPEFSEPRWQTIWGMLNTPLASV